jgi:hypothetical protein
MFLKRSVAINVEVDVAGTSGTTMCMLDAVKRRKLSSCPSSLWSNANVLKRIASECECLMVDLSKRSLGDCSCLPSSKCGGHAAFGNDVRCGFSSIARRGKLIGPKITHHNKNLVALSSKFSRPCNVWITILQVSL